jgi:hypothetical protein
MLLKVDKRCPYRISELIEPLLCRRHTVVFPAVEFHVFFVKVPLYRQKGTFAYCNTNSDGYCMIIYVCCVLFVVVAYVVMLYTRLCHIRGYVTYEVIIVVSYVVMLHTWLLSYIRGYVFLIIHLLWTVVLIAVVVYM